MIYSSVIQGTKKDVTLPFESAADFLGAKVHWTINIAQNALQSRAALDLITAFVNKRESGESCGSTLTRLIEDLQDSLETMLDRIWSKDIQDTSLELPTRTKALQVYLHIVKGLSLLRHPLAYTALGRIIEILSLSNLDPAFVDAAAKGLGVLAESKSKGKHLTAKVGLINAPLQCSDPAAARSEVVEFCLAEIDRRGQGRRRQRPIGVSCRVFIAPATRTCVSALDRSAHCESYLGRSRCLRVAATIGSAISGVVSSFAEAECHHCPNVRS